MKFIFEYWRKEKPHRKAKKEAVVLFDRRRFKTLEIAKKNVNMCKNNWFTEGKNHREENGMVVRDMVKAMWTIEINTTKELLEIMEKLGDLIALTPTDRYKEINFRLWEREEYGW